MTPSKPNQAAMAAYMERRGCDPANDEWMTPDIQAKRPDVKDGFERGVRNARKPQEVAGRPSEMVKNEKPQPVPRPGARIARPVDAQSFNAKWRREQVVSRRETRRETQVKVRQTAGPSGGPNTEAMKTAARDFYVRTRQAERVRDQSAVHLRKHQHLKP